MAADATCGGQDNNLNNQPFLNEYDLATLYEGIPNTSAYLII